MPGSNHVLIKGHALSDISRHRKYINKIITKLNNNTTATDNASSTSDIDITSTKSKTNIGRLSQDPYCFIVDTDDISFIIDTGANRIVVNDTKLLSNLTSANEK